MIYKKDNTILDTPISQSKDWEIIKDFDLIKSNIGTRAVIVYQSIVYLGEDLNSDKKITIFRFFSKNYLKNKEQIELFLNYKNNLYVSFDIYNTFLKVGEKDDK